MQNKCILLSCKNETVKLVIVETVCFKCQAWSAYLDTLGGTVITGGLCCRDNFKCCSSSTSYSTSNSTLYRSIIYNKIELSELQIFQNVFHQKNQSKPNALLISPAPGPNSLSFRIIHLFSSKNVSFFRTCTVSFCFEGQARL